MPAEPALQARLAEALGLEPDRTYRITVQAEDAELSAAESLGDVMDVIGKRTQERGLKADILRDILKDA